MWKSKCVEYNGIKKIYIKIINTPVICLAFPTCCPSIASFCNSQTLGRKTSQIPDIFSILILFEHVRENC